MGSNVKDYLLQALRTMLKPLVKLFISQGVTHAEFAEAAKEIYVEIALRDFETEERINKSRVAILTGLTRKEVKNVIDRALESGQQEKMFPGQRGYWLVGIATRTTPVHTVFPWSCHMRQVKEISRALSDW